MRINSREMLAPFMRVDNFTRVGGLRVFEWLTLCRTVTKRSVSHVVEPMAILERGGCRQPTSVHADGHKEFIARRGRDSKAFRTDAAVVVRHNWRI